MTNTKRPNKLAPRQEAFVREYLVDLNAKQAAIRAGYSKITAAAASSRLLKTPGIRAEINKLKAERSERTEITADRVCCTWKRSGKKHYLKNNIAQRQDAWIDKL